MFVSDRIVFLELQKTGCTHIRNLLQELVGGELTGKHNQAAPGLFSNDRIFLGSVRDPWDWYISLWAYGCDRKGAVFGNLTQKGLKIKGRGWRTNPYAAFRELLRSSPNRNAEKWQRTYEDVSDAGAFREWLYMMHDKEHLPDVGEGYRQSGLSRVSGLLTYRYMRLFACKEGEPDGLHALSTFDHLVEYERRNCFIGHFIRNENLEPDLLAALKLADVQIPVEAESKVMSRPKTNTSSRKNGPGYYYDAGTEAVVAGRDRLIVEKFGYCAPSSRDR
jgi:hypothetical protein